MYYTTALDVIKIKVGDEKKLANITGLEAIWLLEKSYGYHDDSRSVLKWWRNCCSMLWEQCKGYKTWHERLQLKQRSRCYRKNGYSKCSDASSRQQLLDKVMKEPYKGTRHSVRQLGVGVTTMKLALNEDLRYHSDIRHKFWLSKPRRQMLSYCPSRFYQIPPIQINH